jgi:hypothetical protein
MFTQWPLDEMRRHIGALARFRWQCKRALLVDATDGLPIEVKPDIISPALAEVALTHN